MKKILYVSSPGKIGICPFLGYTINGIYEEFEKFLKETYYKPGIGYPLLVFQLINNLELVFVGTQREFRDALQNPCTNRPYRWAIFKRSNRNEPVIYIDIEKDWCIINALLPDKKEQDTIIAQITEIIEKQGFVEIKL